MFGSTTDSWDSEKKAAEKDLCGFLAHNRKIIKITTESLCKATSS